MQLLPLFVLFFASGVAALVYEVVWIRVLSLTLSVTVYALTTVLCAFMAGLGLGAALASRFADRVERPLVAFGLAELGIALSGLVVPQLLYGLGPGYVWLHDVLGPDTPAFTVGRFLLAFCVLLPPTLLMGATLPFLSRVVVAQQAVVGRGAGSLYAANTVGAVLGCVLAGFVLVPALGLSATSLGAAAVNATVGLLALGAGLRRSGRFARTPSKPGPLRRPSAAALLACFAFAVSGATAMGYEILWTRALEPFTHNSTYAYTAMLAMFLLGLGLGSALASRVADRLQSPLLSLGWVQMGIGAAVGVALLVYMRFDTLVPAAASTLGGLGSWPRAIALIFAEAGVTLLVTTILFGATFPLVARSVVDSIDSVGSRIGIAYTANTLGAILGSVAVGFYVLPALGVRGAFVALIYANVALGALLVLASAPAARATGGLVVALGICVATSSLIPPRAFEEVFLRRFGQVLFYREEVTDTVMVTEDPEGGRMIRYADGRGTAGTVTVVEDRMYAHIPLLLHPEPRRVLQIAFGVGNSLASVASHPIERVDCVELSPGVIDAAPFFAETNRGILSDPRVHLVVNDGRNFLLASRESYDVIRLDPPELHTAGVVNLYTREFYEQARDHLAAGGIFSIWVNAVMTPDDDLRRLVRTVQDVFPHVSVWHGPAYYSWVVNGSVEPHRLDLDLLVRKFQDPKVRADLASIGIEDPFHFLAHALLVEDQVTSFSGAGPLVTDDHTHLDFSVARSKESSFGTGNQATGNWLGELLEPDRRGDVVLAAFFRRINELIAHKRPVDPHVVNVEAAGFQPDEVSARIRTFARRDNGRGP
jgi:spermidine synthase